MTNHPIKTVFLLVLLLVVFFSVDTNAQELQFQKYWIAFSDKNNTPYNIDAPEAFLSAKAIERRQKQNIDIVENDLPVDPNYIAQVENLGGEIIYPSKWFNGVVVRVTTDSILQLIQDLPFVVTSEAVARLGNTGSSSQKEEIEGEQFTVHKRSSISDDDDAVFYGTAFHQLQMLNGDYLHANGYTGKDMDIAIMDAGFTNANQMDLFSSLFENGQIKGRWNYVDNNDLIYGFNKHGTHVFSIVGGNLPSTYVGAAPDANYWLFRTEDGASESAIEEFNWIAAAERADEVGVDVINTSLGYSTFDAPFTSYSYEDMDGNTTYISQGADIAASKGILVVSSAGNQGNKQWKYITAPADADSVLTVGAVDSLMMYASFSSQGNTSDGQVKPDVTAQGYQTAYVGTGGSLKKGNGTSYSAPLITGLAACLWQANPDKTNMELIEIIRKSASQYNNPDELLGYGLPNFYRAMLLASDDPIVNFNPEMLAFAYPNPFDESVNVYYYASEDETIMLELYSLTGALIKQYEAEVRKENPYKFAFTEIANYTQGMYLIKVINSKEQKILKVLKG